MRQLLLLIMTTLAAPLPVRGQRVTTAAFQGAVIREDGSPIAEARVEVINSSTDSRKSGRIARLDVLRTGVLDYAHPS